MKYIFLIIFFISCVPNDYFGTLDVRNGVGVQAYVEQQTKFRERGRVERLAQRYRRQHGNLDCTGLDADDPSLVALGADFIVRERLSRESSGGPGCRCIPQGDLCAPRTCSCDEICPNDHGILRSRADILRPSTANTFPFENSPDYNHNVYTEYNMVGGFCTGHNTVTRKMQYLSDFRPSLQSRPKMRKGSPKWRKYMKHQLKRMSDGKTADLVGVAGMHEVMADPKLKRYAYNQLGWRFEGRDPSEASFWNQERRNAFSVSRAEFSHATATKIPAKKALDPESGEEIPPEGTTKYQKFLEGQVEKIMSGHPAIIPGMSNIREVSSNPSVQEILGRQIAIDWKTYNDIDMSNNHFTNYSQTTTWSSTNAQGNNPADPPTTDELNTLRTQAEAYLPDLPSEFPNGRHPGESWNENGPYNSYAISIRMPNIADPTDTGYHSIEAWGRRRMPNGDTQICIRDPNHTQTDFSNDATCANHILIPGPDSGSTATYTGLPSGRRLGKVDFAPSNGAMIGSMTQRLIAFCRKVNRDRFLPGATCSE